MTTKIPDELMDMIVDNITIGLPDSDAIAHAGINPSTFYDWIKRYPIYAQKVKKARVDFKLNNVKKIQNASKLEKHWAASAWLLERRDPDNFGRKDLQVIQVQELPGMVNQIIKVLAEELEGQDIEIVERISQRLRDLKMLRQPEYHNADGTSFRAKADINHDKRIEEKNTDYFKKGKNKEVKQDDTKYDWDN